MCKKFGFLVEFIDFEAEKFYEKKFVSLLENSAPDFIGITATSFAIAHSKELCKIIKATVPQTKIIIGGAHASNIKQKVFEEIPQLDFCVIGEGEHSLIEIMQAKPLKEIKGIVYKKNRVIKKNELRKPIKNIDLLPYPDFSIFSDEVFNKIRIMSSRGCPYGCTFCEVKTIFGRGYRSRSIDLVVEEIKYQTKKYPHKKIMFLDDNMNVNLNHAKNLIKEISKLDVEWGISQGLRADNVDEELFELFKRANVTHIFMGFESGDDKILKTIQKGESVSNFINAVRLARKSQIKTLNCSFIIGLPGETRDSIQKSFKLMRFVVANGYVLSITPLRVFPGTIIWNYFETHGHILNLKRDHRHKSVSNAYSLLDVDAETKSFSRLDAKIAYIHALAIAWIGKLKQSNLKHSFFLIISLFKQMRQYAFLILLFIFYEKLFFFKNYSSEVDPNNFIH